MFTHGIKLLAWKEEKVDSYFIKARLNFVEPSFILSIFIFKKI